VREGFGCAIAVFFRSVGSDQPRANCEKCWAWRHFRGGMITQSEENAKKRREKQHNKHLFTVTPHKNISSAFFSLASLLLIVCLTMRMDASIKEREIYIGKKKNFSSFFFHCWVAMGRKVAVNENRYRKFHEERGMAMQNNAVTHTTNGGCL
jgi:hypothetical protein